MLLLSASMSWYVVHAGRKTGVFSTWEACHEQVIGFKGACYRKYKTREEAFAAFNGAQLQALVEPGVPKIKMGGYKWKDIVILVEGAIILVQALVILILLSKSV